MSESFNPKSSRTMLTASDRSWPERSFRISPKIVPHIGVMKEERLIDVLKRLVPLTPASGGAESKLADLSSELARIDAELKMRDFEDVTEFLLYRRTCLQSR